MDEYATRIQQLLLSLNEVERKLFEGDQISNPSSAVAYAIERIGFAKVALSRAQATFLSDKATDSEDLDAFLSGSSLSVSCHHALVHNPFVWND